MQLYVRDSAAAQAEVCGVWRWYVDGVLHGVEGDEIAARAAAEAAARAMLGTHARVMAAAAGKRRAAKA